MNIHRHKSCSSNFSSNIHNSPIDAPSEGISGHVTAVVPRAYPLGREQSFNQTTSHRPHRRHTYTHTHTAAQTKSAAQGTYSEKANTHTPTLLHTHPPWHFLWQFPLSLHSFLSHRIQPHVSKQTVNGNRRTLRKCCRRWRRGDEAEGGGVAGAISGTSRATYLYKFMATCAAICLCQLMTGPDTKVMKTPQSDPDPMRLSSRVSNIARILRTAEQQKSVKCGYFLFKRKNRVCVCVCASTAKRKMKKKKQ